MASAVNSVSEDQEIYCFQLVEFVGTHGSKSKKKRSLDIIPSSWMSFDTKEGKLVAKFMPPPYDSENIELLYSLVETEGIAPESWPTYSVKIRGHAKTYSEAIKRLKVLENEDYAFTENEGQEIRAKSIESKYRRNKLTLSQQTTKAMKVSSIESEDEKLEESTDEQTTNSSSDDSSILECNKKDSFKKPAIKSKTTAAISSSSKKNSKPIIKSSQILGKKVSISKANLNTDSNSAPKAFVQSKDINKNNIITKQDDQSLVKTKKNLKVKRVIVAMIVKKIRC
ncbi:uncharacterized protein LOC127280850 isoform X1 [Leptopilina boulardi]|uniref:uncharacterized protein LOC127280850 isoform X1 n=2 Tax=Leptopilina boulardi TaxID=63433 RepID=UPI0021F579DC|nr:uncharacterized protein LOC127280850 isoform X1 [Leptopilina boulardi]